jgi:hypothetical protein
MPSSSRIPQLLKLKSLRFFINTLICLPCCKSLKSQTATILNIKAVGTQSRISKTHLSPGSRSAFYVRIVLCFLSEEPF